jgi:hypothetical protein
MSQRSSVLPSPKTGHLVQRLASPFSKQNLSRIAHMMGPTLVALAFAGVSSGVAHAQGTMDFSGATTLMGTFNYRNDYVGVEQWSRNIVRGHYVHLVALHEQHQRFSTPTPAVTNKTFTSTICLPQPTEKLMGGIVLRAFGRFRWKAKNLNVSSIETSTSRISMYI